MSETIEVRGNIELRLLDASWSPWKAQVNRYVDDGKDYGRPGVRICTSMSNFESLDEAREAFESYLKRNGR